MRKLRIGLLIVSHESLEPWAVRLVDKISRADALEIVAFVKTNKNPIATKSNLLLRTWLLFESKFLSRPIRADRSNCIMIAKSIPTLAAKDYDDIANRELDVLVDICGVGAEASLAKCSKFGSWYLDICTSSKNVAGFWEAAGKLPASNIILCQNPSDGSKLRAIAKATVNTKLSMTQNALFMKEKAIALLLRELKRVYYSNRCDSVEENLNTPKIRPPSTVDVLKYIFRLVGKLGDRLIMLVLARTGFRSRMFFLKTGIGSPLSLQPEQGTALIPTGNTYWADPFLWEKDGEIYCFFENYDYSRKRGHISVGKLVGERLEFIGDALKREYHLSYPHVFEDQDELYMLPETNKARRIEIWRCTGFPLKWELHATGLDGVNTADSVILKNEGKYWLFTNIAGDVYDDNSSELHIFEIDGPSLNKIIPHKNNPVVFDSRTARGGGRFHKTDGKIYRPSQDNAYGLYGYGLNLMEVEILSLSKYREKLIWRISPEFEPGLQGCHHFDICGERYIIDALKAYGGRGEVQSD